MDVLVSRIRLATTRILAKLATSFGFNKQVSLAMTDMLEFM
jgi:hypothetical protein